jgi:glycosyltransferase involved in cell wall biosynthesis
LKLSIIIPVYNVEKYITRCLDSLVNQNLEACDYEIIIIDDGSKDNSLSIAKLYSAKYENIYIYSQENKGVGAARNKGLELAKGDYVYFIDADDYLASNVLKTILSYCVEDLDILTFLSRGTTESNLKESVTNKKSLLAIKYADGIEYIANNKFNNEIWWYIINKAFLIKTGIRFIEGRWMEDAIFTATIFLKANAVVNLPIDGHRHVVVPESAMTSKKPSLYLKIIYDNANAAIVYQSLIQNTPNNNEESMRCINRLKTRQQSFVFFMMVRMLQSTIKINEIKKILVNLEKAGAYPLNSFLGQDYNKVSYKFIVRIFNHKYMYYVLFKIFNSVFNLMNKVKG